MTDAVDIPVLPPTRARALTILSSSSPEPLEITEVVRADPALAAAVLRASNSAWSAPRAPIDAVDRAIIRIGTREALRMVGVAVLYSTFTNLRAAGLDPTELCRHVVASALLTEEAVDPSVSRGVRAAAYTAGLLHDLGRLAMADLDGPRYRRVVAAARGGADPLDAERTHFGVDHATLGVRVGAAWGIADDLLDAIGAHHGSGSARPLTRAVRRVRPVVWALGIGDGVLAPESQEDAETSGDAGASDGPAASPSTRTPKRAREKLPVEDDLLVHRLGGEQVFMSRVRWLSSAVNAPRAAA